MKTQYTEPRWADPQLRGALDAVRAEAPSAAQVERMIASVSSALDAPSTGATATHGALPALKLTVLGAALAGAAVFGSVFLAPGARQQPAPARAHEVTAPATPRPALIGPHLEPPAAVPELVDATQAPSAPSAVPRAKPRPERAVGSPDIAGEIALLHRARRALEASPRSALALLAQHRKLAAPAFAEERDALEIEALLGAGERERAKLAERAFRARYPSSAYLRRIERVLGE